MTTISVLQQGNRWQKCTIISQVEDLKITDLENKIAQEQRGKLNNTFDVDNYSLKLLRHLNLKTTNVLCVCGLYLIYIYFIN